MYEHLASLACIDNASASTGLWQDGSGALHIAQHAFLVRLIPVEVYVCNNVLVRCTSMPSQTKALEVMNTPLDDRSFLHIVGVMDGIQHDFFIQPFSAANIVCSQLSTYILLAESTL